ncbi:MAG: hypothetical protein OXG24_07140 [Gammaproteobacteria bacterium]|nr:hypothetical protein [Gammaproteobacteria bacterium]
MKIKKNDKILVAIGVFIGFCTSAIVCISYKSILDTPSAEGVLQSTVEYGKGQTGFKTNLHLHKLVEIDSPFDRQNYVNSLSDDIGQNKLVALIEESSTLQLDRGIAMIQEFLVTELARISAPLALDQIWAFPRSRWKILVSIIFAEWSKSDFSVALKHAASLNGYLKLKAIQSTIVTRNDLPDNQRLHEARKHGVEQIALRVICEDKARALLHDPSSALHQTLTDEIDNELQVDVLSEIVHAWVHKEDTEAVGALVDVLRSHGLESSPLLHRLLVEATKFDLQTMWEYALNATAETQEIIQPAILSTWVKENASHALSVLSQIKDPIRRSNLRNYALFHWSSKRPDDALDNLNSVPQENRHLVIANAIREFVRQDRLDDAVEHLTLLDSQEQDTSRAKDYLISIWSRKNANDALAWVLENTHETSSLRKKLLRTVLRHLALLDPSRALNVALTHPVNESKRHADHLEHWVIQSLAANGRFGDVLPMMSKVRNTTRLPTFLMVGRSYIEFNQMDQVVELADKLPKSIWPEYYAGLVSEWLSSDPENLVYRLGHIPDATSQKSIVQQILQNQRVNEYLSLEQLRYLKSFLEPETRQ